MAGAAAATKNDRNSSADDPLASFLISKSTVQARPLQSTNLTSLAQKPKVDNAARTGAKANAEQDPANAADIFRELDEEGEDFMGQELGYRGMEDSEHEDSEEADPHQPEARQEGGREEDGEEGDEDPGVGGTAYLTDVRTMRPYDEEDEPLEQPGRGPPPFGSSYAPAEGRPYDSRPQWPAGTAPQKQEGARPGGNRGAMKLLSAANTAALRPGASRDRKRSYRQRGHSRNDEAFETSSGQGHQGRELHKMKFEKASARDDPLREEPGRRKHGHAGQELGAAKGGRQLTSWKDTMADADSSKAGNRELEGSDSNLAGHKLPLSKWNQ